MSANRHHDVIIIGTGAGGGTLAWALAPTGKRILILERGDWVPRELANWSTRAVNVEGRYQTKEVWRDADGQALHPHTNYGVGGNTKFYGAALFRLRREDFGEIRHHGGLSPAWPIAYEDFEPYYTRAEQLYHVHGQRGADPTEPPASAPYPYPPVSHEPRMQQLSDDFARRGLKPFPVPLGIMLDEKNQRTSKCIRCGTCDGHPCLVSAKSDAQVVAVEPALEHPNVTLLTGAYVSRLETSRSGHEVTQIIVERNGAHEVYSADVVVVAGGAINSAALLLRSAYPTALLMDESVKQTGEECMVVAQGGRVIALTKKIPARYDMAGEGVGFLKVRGADTGPLIRSVQAYVERGQLDMEYEDALLEFFAEVKVGYERIGGLPWTEIDFEEDVARAEREILPKLG